MEEEDIVVGFETVGPRSHEKEELPDSITTGGQVAGLCPTTASMALKNVHSFLPLPVFPVQYLIFL